MSRERDEGIRLLRELGLNQLEAEVYTFLLPAEPTTAYGIGKALGRPTANVYKAIERLARAGAVLVEEGESRVCRAVPVRELIGHTLRELRDKARAAERVLSSLQRETFDERVYRIESVAEVIERAGAMLGRARTVAVVDAFPSALEAVLPAIRGAVTRGVAVHVEAYRPTPIEGADVVVVPEGAASLEAWRSEQLNVVVDGREHLLALLAEDLEGVHQAVWSRSVYLSCLHHSGRMNEIALIRLMGEAAKDRGEVARLLREPPFFRNSVVPGHRELVRRFGRKRRGEP